MSAHETTGTTAANACGASGEACHVASPASDGVSACACHHKQTPRSEALQKDVTCRINRAIGQLGGVKSMIDDNRYCGDVLIQLAAAQSAIKAVSAEILQDHLETCVVERIQAGDTEVIDEVVQLLRRFS